MNSSGKGKEKPLKVYCCAECGGVEKKTTTPKVKGCPRSPFHRWIHLGIVGNNSYTCSHCKVAVRVSGVPSSYGCRERVFHDWKS